MGDKCIRSFYSDVYNEIIYTIAKVFKNAMWFKFTPAADTGIYTDFSDTASVSFCWVICSPSL